MKIAFVRDGEHEIGHAKHLVIVLKGSESQVAVVDGPSTVNVEPGTTVFVATAGHIESLNGSRHMPLTPITVTDLPYETRATTTEKQYYTLQVGDQVFKWILFCKGHLIKKHIHTDLGMLKLQFTGSIRYDTLQVTSGGEFLALVPGLEHYEGEVLEETVLLTIENVGSTLKEFEGN